MKKVKENSMKWFKTLLGQLRNILRSIKRFPIIEAQLWKYRLYDAPSPWYVKIDVLVRNSIPHATWVETGTFLGETTRILANHGTQVFSIEPAYDLYARAEHKFRNQTKIKILNGKSEDVFPILLKDIEGSVNFWLDGHYSAGATYQGEKDTPIAEELQHIERNMSRYSGISVFVDDVRCFGSSLTVYSTYPNIDYLVDWARRNKLKWHIEHDIFVAKK